MLSLSAVAGVYERLNCARNLQSALSFNYDVFVLNIRLRLSPKKILSCSDADSLNV